MSRRDRIVLRLRRARSTQWLSAGLVGAALFLAGCAGVPRSSADANHIRIELIDSPLVRVSQAWLERVDGVLRLKGHVLRLPDVADTTATHLDVSLLSANGTLVGSSTEYFQPRQIPRRPRRPDFAAFDVVIPVNPAEVQTIIIKAHEGDHP